MREAGTEPAEWIWDLEEASPLSALLPSFTKWFHLPSGSQVQVLRR